jgi:tripartite-type tricarboxylate transporter receptor subunit TctC
MKLHGMVCRGLAALLLAGCAAAAPALAQGWPARPVKMVVSQPPGTGPDIIVRMFADFLSKEWGQAAVVENEYRRREILSKAIRLQRE